jgi:hypothetical protein
MTMGSRMPNWQHARACAVLIFIGCGDGSAGSECHSTRDCDVHSGLACVGQTDHGGCGIPPRQDCSGDVDCNGVAQRCHAILDSCSPDGIGSECRPACAQDGECGSDLRCDAGACVAISCAAGFACAGREVCEPARIPASAPVYDRHHGCFLVTCAADSECGSRFCVNGSCQDLLGTCMEPQQVP